MRLAIETQRCEIDPWLDEYVGTTVAFATWWADRSVERVDVRIERSSGAAGEPFLCRLRATTAGFGIVSAEAGARDCCEAIQEAADRLEVALSGAMTVLVAAATRRLAA